METLLEVRKIKTITLRLSDELHKKIKFLTVEDEITIQDYITQLIENNLKQRQKDNQQNK